MGRLDQERVEEVDELGGVERAALRLAVLLLLKNTVPRKMATVTHKTPKFPQKTPLQPELKSGAESNNVLRSANIHPPMKLAWPAALRTEARPPCLV